MRNDLLHIVTPQMYYASTPTPTRRSIFDFSPADRLGYERELAQQQAYEEEMAEQMYQERLYNELMRRKAQQEERKRQRAAREQALRMLLLKEEEEKEKARIRRARIMKMMSQPEMGSKVMNGRPQIIQGRDGRLYQEVSPDYYGINERMDLDSDEEKYDYNNLRQRTIPQCQSNAPFQCKKPTGKRSVRNQNNTAPIMVHIVDTTSPKVMVTPKITPKKPSVMVEDASDSEIEDEFKSYIRNRRPRDGEWMEPVEAYQRD
jgi:hypothetical protein